MKLVVLGATGQTGKEVVQQALEAGHTVTAVVRNPAKMTTTHDNLKVVEGNIFDKSSLTDIFKDNDAVVSCLGFLRKPQPVTGYTESAAAIVPAMKEANVKRFVTMTSWYSDITSGARGGFVVNWCVVPFLRPVLINMKQMENYVESSCADIDYTVIRPPELNNEPLSGRAMNVAEDYLVNTGTSRNRMGRADVASFILVCLKSKEYNNKMVAIVPQK